MVKTSITKVIKETAGDPSPIVKMTNHKVANQCFKRPTNLNDSWYISFFVQSPKEFFPEKMGRFLNFGVKFSPTESPTDKSPEINLCF